MVLHGEGIESLVRSIEHGDVQKSNLKGIIMKTPNEARPAKLVWHYTYGAAFNGIKKDGIICQATAFIPDSELPITWFSTEQYWEPTVTKGALLPDGTIKNLNMTGMLAADIRSC